MADANSAKRPDHNNASLYVCNNNQSNSTIPKQPLVVPAPSSSCPAQNYSRRTGSHSRLKEQIAQLADIDDSSDDNEQLHDV